MSLFEYVAPTVQLILSGGVGAALLQLSGRPRERREQRAQVLHALKNVEHARWADATGTWDRYIEAARDFEVAALVAGLDRAVVERYLIGADAARQESDDDYQTRMDNDTGGIVSTELTTWVTGYALLVTASIWKPIRSRLTRQHDLQRLTELYEKLGHAEKQRIADAIATHPPVKLRNT